MGVESVSSPIDIAVSGLRAEAARLKIIANNIANSSTSRTPSGQPYRRRDLVLSTDMGALTGVRVLDVVEDSSTDFKRLYQPGHPDADKDGYVMMPNVELPVEVMHMVAASKAYQANAAVLKRYQDMAEATLELLR